MVEFYSGISPKGFKSDFEPFLFNTATHRNLQSKTDWLEFHLINRDKKKILSSVFFLVSKGKASSPFKAPFGGFEISNQVQPEIFYDFAQRIEHELKKIKVKQIEIVCPPELYTLTQPLVTTTLLSLGYQVVQAESGCAIVVDKKSLIKKMFKDKRNRFESGKKAGFTYHKIPISEVSNIYKFIELYRKKLNRSLSMTELQLVKTVETLPDSFFMVGVYLQSELVSACICIRVSRSIVYTFYSAHNDSYNKLSPRVFLLKNLYDWCYKQGVTLLDLGTSTIDQHPNFSLLDFKLRMGGTLTPKYQFRKIVNP